MALSSHGGRVQTCPRERAPRHHAYKAVRIEPGARSADGKQDGKDKSSKSVRNAHGLLSAALAEYKPDMVLRTTLPQKQKPEISIPTDEDIGHIMQAAVGTEMEFPVLLAIWLGLRVSEIRGLTWNCISGDTIHIKQAIVEGENGPEVKGTKTYSGDRKLRLPPYLSSLIERQPHTDDYIVHMSGQAIYKRFVRLCEKEGLPHFRFHDLRHANASVMLAPIAFTPVNSAYHKLGKKVGNAFSDGLKLK